MGIFGGQGPNPSAALLKNGILIAMAEEERFIRIKNAPSLLPIRSIKFCLDYANINIDDVEKIGFAWDCEEYVKSWPSFSRNMRSSYNSFDQSYDLIYESRLLANFNPIRIKQDLKFGLAKLGIKLDEKKIKFLNHHKCHAASVYFQSGFNNAGVLCIDGSGEEITTSMWLGDKNNLTLLWKSQLPNSIGGFYASFTEFLGFKSNSEEGKLMGLAPYGEYSSDIQKKLEHFIEFDFKTGEIKVNLRMRFIGDRSYNSIFTDELVKLFGPPRLSKDPITKYYKDIAFNVQFKLEEIVTGLILNLMSKTKSRNICLAGGVAMNCKMNGKIAAIPEVEKIFVQPASSDNGTSIGAAILVALEKGVNSFEELNHCYYGPEYSDEEIEKLLVEAKIKYTRVENLSESVSNYLLEGELVGWFQGRSEFGARALGNRSILANPLHKNMKDKLNLEVKHREEWRPFCPSLTKESYKTYFGETAKSPFMILAFPVIQQFHEIIPAVVHIDGTARPQSVDKIYNPAFHSLLETFGNKSGHPVLINTSFNVQGEPIVDTPADALRCFFSTGLDVLALGPYIIRKNLT
jgi:carbamoyltransferase